MKSRILFFLSFYFLFLNGMENDNELSILAEYRGQEEWQPHTGGWKPWDTTPLSSVVHHAKSEEFLHSIAKSYESIREGAFKDPDFFTEEYLKQTSMEHTWRLKNIIKQHGWPTEENFDAQSAQAAFIIAQHANHDDSFQQNALKYLSSLKSTEACQNYAYLSDRILINRGQPQYYGTLCNSKGDLYPIQGYNPSADNSDQTESQLKMMNDRRASASLPTLQESLQKLSIFNLTRLFTLPQSALLSQ